MQCRMQDYLFRQMWWLVQDEYLRLDRPARRTRRDWRIYLERMLLRRTDPGPIWILVCRRQNDNRQMYRDMQDP